MIEDEILNGFLGLGNEHSYNVGVYSVTELLSCPKKAYYYRLLGMKPEVNAMMLTGTFMHELLPRILANVPHFKDAKYEVPCSYSDNEIKITGIADIVTDRVWEAKLTGSRPDSKNGLPTSYYNQVNCYCNMLGIKKYSILTIDRFAAPFTVKSIAVTPGERDESIFDTVIERAKILDGLIRKKEMPEGPMYSWECKNKFFKCHMYDLCGLKE